MINIGGAAPSVILIKRMEEAFGCRCVTGYGLTEASPVLTLATLKSTLQEMNREDRLKRQAMTGLPQVGVDLRVVNEGGCEVAHDGQQVGEIIVRADGVMLGYWRQPEESVRGQFAMAGSTPETWQP